MSVAAPTPTASADPPSEPVTTTGEKPRQWPVHLCVAVIALSFAVYVTSGLWRDPFTHVLADNVGDQAFFEWLMGYGYYTVTQGSDPFFASLLNAPLGVNLAANTSITVYTVLMTPITHFAGPQISFVTVLTLNLAGSAFAWYLFLRRWLVRDALAAAVAGMFCGFAPGFISHANGHLNWTAGWVAPVVIWQVLKLREEGRWLRNGLILGLLLAVGFSIAAEGLFFTALASGVFVVAWSVAGPVRAEARAALPTVAKALAVTAVIAGTLLAYPLYMHFGGPQTFSGTGFNQRYFVEDAAAYLSFPSRSLAGFFGWHADLAPNRTEETSFFGVPLVLLLLVSFVLLWRRADPGRRATLRAVAIVGIFFFLLSLGPRLNINKHEYNDIPLPYAVLMNFPLFDSALPIRFALGVVGVFGVLLALLVDQLLSRRDDEEGGTLNSALASAVVVSLLPILPLPVRIQHRAPEPAFIAQGIWKTYVPEGGTLSALPFAMNVTADGQRWQSYTMARGGQQFKIPDGYFLGPQASGEEGKKQTGRIGAPPRATDWLFLRAAWYGYVTRLTNEDRAQARADFQYWGLDAVFLAPEITGSDHQTLNRQAVEATARDLLGEPEEAGGVLVWRIRRGTDPVDR